METITLYRPTGPNELELVRESGYSKWLPRLPEQSIFYAVTNKEYAKEIAIKWNIKDSKVRCITIFQAAEIGVIVKSCVWKS